MKKASFRFYEELNDFLPSYKRKKNFEHSFKQRASVKDLIESFGVPHTEIDLILANGKSVDFNYIVQDNDGISVYPIFESFDVSDIQNLRPKPLRNPKFIIDVNLGKLVKLLRIAGIDSLYQNDFNDEQILKISRKSNRTILTRDTGLLKRKEVTHGYFVRNTKPENQLLEVIERFHLKKIINPFIRCLECNSILKKIEKEKIINRIPQKVKDYLNEFYICINCDKVYWKGTHYEKMEKMLLKII